MVVENVEAFIQKIFGVTEFIFKERTVKKSI